MRAELVPKTDLAQVLQYNVSTLDISIGRFDSAVFASTEAVIVKIFLVAVGALPENISRLKVHLVAKLLLDLAEIFKEVNCAVRRAREPEIDIDDVMLGDNKFAHDDELGEFALGGIFHPV